MDRVRFGRALGFGARQAAKTLLAAADAAAAESPTARSTGRGANIERAAAPQAQHAATRSPRSARPATQTAVSPTSNDATWAAAKKAAGAVVQARQVQRGLGRGGKQFGEAVWKPFVRLSGVVWLEVSGVFFGIFALIALGYIWKLREAWHTTAANQASHRSLMGAIVMLALFGYFCLSSFARARRRERGR